MKIIPDKIQSFKIKTLTEENSEYTLININESANIVYKNTSKSDLEVLSDLLEHYAYASALLFLNENYELEVGKFEDSFKESDNIEEDISNYLKECNELLYKNVKIVEAQGPLLTSINGYPIYESENSILRGAGKKKIQESFNDEDQELDLFPAIKNKVLKMIEDKAKKDDIYDLIDGQVSVYSIDKEEAAELKSLVNSLIEENSNTLYACYEEPFNGEKKTKEQWEEVYNSDIIDKNTWPDFEDWWDDMINHSELLVKEAEGTQCSDIAGKTDQEVGINIPNTTATKKKKHTDILLSDLEEGLPFINKGFLKNSEGQYQRGNYILVKEGDKYLAINKNKLKEDL